MSIYHDIKEAFVSDFLEHHVEDIVAEELKNYHTYCEDDDGTLKPAIERVLEDYMDSSKYEAWRRASAEKALQDMATWQEENGLYGFIEEHVTRSYSGRQQNDDVEPKEKNIRAAITRSITGQQKCQSVNG